MSNETIGRLMLEASTGIHGYVAKDLAGHLAFALQQRAELLEALKEILELSENLSMSDRPEMQKARNIIEEQK